MLAYLARGFLLRRLFGGGSRRRGSGGFYAPRRGHRSQSNVRVFGCCLPGCGVMTLVPTLGAWMAGRQALRAARRR